MRPWVQSLDTLSTNQTTMTTTPKVYVHVYFYTLPNDGHIVRELKIIKKTTLVYTRVIYKIKTTTTKKSQQIPDFSVEDVINTISMI